MTDNDGYKAPAGTTPYLFDAVLYPNRSLGRRGFLVLMIILLGFSVVSGGLFWSRGAWPITGFYVLEVFIVWYAFRMNNRAGRDYETIRLTRDELVVEDHSRRKKGHKRWVFNPAWVRVDLRNPGAHESTLTIMSHGKGVAVGAFLSPQERLDVAEALRSALKRTI